MSRPETLKQHVHAASACVVALNVTAVCLYTPLRRPIATTVDVRHQLLVPSRNFIRMPSREVFAVDSPVYQVDTASAQHRPPC